MTTDVVAMPPVSLPELLGLVHLNRGQTELVHQWLTAGRAVAVYARRAKTPGKFTTYRRIVATGNPSPETWIEPGDTNCEPLHLMGWTA